MKLSPTELSLVDRWQRGFPLVSRPFEVVGRSVGIGERAAIETFERLLRQQVLSRIGAVVRPHTVGASTLAAMRVPQERLEAVAAIVSRETLVTHNYQRTHDFNLWFVVAGPHAGSVEATLKSVRERTGLAVLDLPMQRAYHLDLGFSLQDRPDLRVRSRRPKTGYCPAAERQLLAVIENGLPIVARPYRRVATALDLDEDEVTERLRCLIAAGIVTRFGCVVRHRALGYAANAMAVWDIAADRVDGVAGELVRNPRVTLCYRRARHLPEWPYNLYCMVHARSRQESLAVVDELNRSARLGDDPQAILFSTRCFKQRGAVFSTQDRTEDRTANRIQDHGRH
jgi:DNA-binding Lrp family transcriptional regulator